MTRDHLIKLRQLIVKASESLTDGDALQAIELFEEWNGNGVEYKEGKRVRYGGVLYKVRQTHVSQLDYAPDVAVSLFEQVAEPGQGTKDNPIPYNNNMALEEGKYYIQNGIEYYCYRDTGSPVFNNLSDLVGFYVLIVTD